MEKNKTYKFIYWGLIFLFLGLTSSPTLVSGYHILVFIPTVLIYKSGFRFNLPKSSYALIFLIVWGLFATLYNHGELIKPFKAYQELKYYFFGIFSIGTISYFLSFREIKRHKKLLNLLLFTIVIGFFVGISRSKFEFDPVKMMSVPGKYHTRAGGFTNYMRYGYSSALLLVLGFGAWFNYSKVKHLVSKKWLIVFTVFCLLAVLFSETRGAVLALISGFSFLLLKYKPKIGKTLISLGVLGVIAIGIISYTKSSKSRYMNINDGSNKKRMSQFYSAYKSILERPLLGLGADQFSYNVTKIKKKYDIWSKQYSGHSHNIFLEHGANYGVPGLLAFMAFLIFWFIELVKLGTDTAWVIASYLVAFVIGGQVELLFDVINSHLIFFLYSYSQVHRINISKV